MPRKAALHWHRESERHVKNEEPSQPRALARNGDGIVPSIPDNSDTLLTRERAAQALTDAGYPVSPKTLATKATRGGGPLYSLFSGRALYRWGDALDWARSLTSSPRRSTAEADVQRKSA